MPIPMPSRRPGYARVLALLVILVSGFGAWITHGQGAEAPGTSSGPLPLAPAGGLTLLADTDYGPAVERLLGSAAARIDVTMFSCVLPTEASPKHPVRKLLDRLIERAKAGVAVRIVLDHGVPLSRQKEGEELPSDAAARYLKAAGIDVRWDEDRRTTHTKSLTVDSRWCVVGSTNWTYSALLKNREQSVLVDSPALAKELTERFDQLWRLSTPVE